LRIRHCPTWTGNCFPQYSRPKNERKSANVSFCSGAVQHPTLRAENCSVNSNRTGRLVFRCCAVPAPASKTKTQVVPTVARPCASLRTNARRRPCAWRGKRLSPCLSRCTDGWP